MNNVSQTILSQYASSPTITTLIQSMNDAIDPTADLAAFYNNIWNIKTAKGYGLDVWGQIVNVSRTLNLFIPASYFGFSEAYSAGSVNNPQPFNQLPMYSGQNLTTNYVLSDDLYRDLILVKALTNISNLTAPAVNKIVSYVTTFNISQNGSTLGVSALPWTLQQAPQTIPILGQSSTILPFYLPTQTAMSYVQDIGNMQMRIIFNYYPTQIQLAILLNTGLILRPSGVQMLVVQFDPYKTFGFAEANGNPWASSTMLPSTGVQNAA